MIGMLVALILSAAAAEPIRIGLTPTFLNERHALMADWRAYLERKLKQPVVFVLRDSYQETLEMLHQRRLDVAWLCDCPHVTDNPEFRLMATPLFQGRPFYRAYLIVPEEDQTTRTVFDLKNKVFAYTDPYSNVGYLFPRYELKQSGIEPDFFFGVLSLPARSASRSKPWRSGLPTRLRSTATSGRRCICKRRC